mgnify:CR=1 FL=1
MSSAFTEAALNPGMLLTDAGAEYELDYFRTRRFRKPLDREDAYALARMVYAAQDNPDVLAVARRALKAARPKQRKP